MSLPNPKNISELLYAVLREVLVPVGQNSGNAT